MISGLFTTAAFLMFLGVLYWAYTRHNRQRFDEAAQLVFEDTAIPARPAAQVDEHESVPACCSGRHS